MCRSGCRLPLQPPRRHGNGVFFGSSQTAGSVPVQRQRARSVASERRIQMNGMEMGFNRYDLHPSDNGTFVSSVTLPVCVSGRRDWTLTLEIDGVHYALPFSTR